MTAEAKYWKLDREFWGNGIRSTAAYTMVMSSQGYMDGVRVFCEACLEHSWFIERARPVALHCPKCEDERVYWVPPKPESTPAEEKLNRSVEELTYRVAELTKLLNTPKQRRWWQR